MRSFRLGFGFRLRFRFCEDKIGIAETRVSATVEAAKTVTGTVGVPDAGRPTRGDGVTAVLNGLLSDGRATRGLAAFQRPMLPVNGDARPTEEDDDQRRRRRKHRTNCN